MRRIAKWVTGVVLGILLLLGVFVFLWAGGVETTRIALAHTVPNNLEFDFSRCKDESGHKEKIDSVEWTSTNTINVKGVVYPNCGTSWVLGDYEINSSTITLKYQAIVPTFFACECGVDVTYTIADIEKKDYSIEIQEMDVVDATPYWIRDYVYGISY